MQHKSWWPKLCLLSMIGIGNSSSHAINLIDAYQLALVNDPAFQSAIKEYEAGLQNQTIGRAAILPKLTAAHNQASNWARQSGAAYSGGPQIINNYQYPSNYMYLQLLQPIFNLEAYARWRQGATQTEMSNTKFVFNNQDLLIRVVQTYVDFLSALDQLQSLTVERDVLHEQWKASKNLARHGEASKIDVLDAETNYQIAVIKVMEADNSVNLAKQKLGGTIGTSPDRINKVDGLSANFQLPSLTKHNFDDWKQSALKANIELKMAEQAIEVARQEYRKNHALNYPVVNIIGSVARQESNTPTTIAQTMNQSYVGIQVTMPLFSGGEIYGKSSQAYANYEKAKADYDVMKEKITMEIRKQFDLVVMSTQKITAMTAAYNLASETVKAMRRSNIFGDKTYIDVLIAEKRLQITYSDLAQTKYNYLIAYLKLHQLSGELSINQFENIANSFK